MRPAQSSNWKVQTSKLFSYCLLLSAAFILSSSSAQSPQQLYTNAKRLYEQKKFDDAIKVYGQLINSGHVAPEVYFNCGNAYYKTGNFASAILNYERARLLAPADDDILFNLRLANMNTVDRIEPAPQVFYQRWWNHFRTLLTESKWASSSLILIYIALAFAVGYILLRHIVLRKISFFLAAIALITGFFFLFMANRQHSMFSAQRFAIIMHVSEYVKSSPEEKSTNLFMLHSGTKIEVLDQLSGWKKIRIANGNVGWIKADAIEFI